MHLKHQFYPFKECQTSQLIPVSYLSEIGGNTSDHIIRGQTENLFWLFWWKKKQLIVSHMFSTETRVKVGTTRLRCFGSHVALEQSTVTFR